MSVYPKQRASELFGLLFIATSLLLLLSLATYSAFDPSLNMDSSSVHHSNYVGKIGAWSSDVLFQILGWAAFCLPIPLFLAGYKRMRGRAWVEPFLKFFGVSCLIVSFSTILALLAPVSSGTVNYTPGGIVGILLSDRLVLLLNRPGSLVVVATALVLSLVLTTRFSLDQLLTRLGSRNWNFWSGIWTEAQRRLESRRDRHAIASWKKRDETIVAQTLPQKAALKPQRGESGPALGTIEITEAHDSRAETQLQPLAVASSQNSDRRHTLPPLEFLQEQLSHVDVDEQDLIKRAELLTVKCAEFGVLGHVFQIHPGPVVTTFEFKPDPGVKYNRITNLENDLCLALKAESIRIERIPGKNTVGIEVPNLDRQTIYLREILGSTGFQQAPSFLTLGLGKLINGNTHMANLERMPHLLVAGATGSGKSVALNCIVCSILYKATPDKVRFIMIDPKRLELGVYSDIPHLLTPIVTDPKQAANALNWAVHEMEERYRQLARVGVRSIDQYNEFVEKNPDQLEGEALEPLPYIVVIVDELADLMLTAGKEVETAVTRLAQMARAIGIHLILATQRPSVDVITGLIKANFPSRISCRVSSKIDSRTILDANGAEQLLGLGDMLFLGPGTSRLIRVHGAYISIEEIARVTSFLKAQAEPDYQGEILEGEEEKESGALGGSPADDTLFDEAARFIVENRKASTSLLQRRFRIGYGRAARLLDIMEDEGLVGPSEGSKPREVLVPPDYYQMDV